MVTKTLVLDRLYPDGTPAVGTRISVTVDRDIAIKGAGTIAQKGAATHYDVAPEGTFPTVEVVPNDDPSLQDWSLGYALIIEAEKTPSGGVTGGPWTVVVTSEADDTVRLSDFDRAIPPSPGNSAASPVQMAAPIINSTDAITAVTGAQSSAANSEPVAAASGADVSAAALVGAPAGSAIDTYLGGDSASLVHAAGRVVLPSGDTRGATDRTNLTAALADSGGARLVPGDYYVDIPVQLASGQFVIGRGKRITKVHSTGSGSLAGIVFLTGNYHPNYYPDNLGGTGAYRFIMDTLAAPTENATVVTRTTTTLTIDVGDLVLVKTDVSLGHLRRVVAVEGDDIALHKPLDGVTGATVAAITTGDGATYTITDSTGATVNQDSYLCEKVTIQDLSVDAPASIWTARGACLEGIFSGIDAIDSHALIYGNALTDCEFSDITGNFRSRCIEIADGGRDNAYRGIRGTWVGGISYKTRDALVNLGVNSCLEDYDITDMSGRAGAWLGFALSDRWRVGRGVIRAAAATASSTPRVRFGNNKGGHRIDGLQLDIFGLLKGNIFRLEDTDDTTIRNVHINNPGGRVSGAMTFTIHRGVTRSLIDNVTDSNGNDEYKGGDAAGCSMQNLSWRNKKAGRTTAGAGTVVLSQNDQDRMVTFNRSGDQVCSISDLTNWGLGVSVRLLKTGTGTLTITAADSAVLAVDPTVTLPAATGSSLVVTKLDATTFHVTRE